MKFKYIAPVILAITLCGCQGKSSHDPHQGHDHEQPGEPHSHAQEEGHGHEQEEAHVHDAKLNLIAYSQQTEFFAEADPFYTGGKSDLFIQLCRLDNFKPLDNVKLEFELQIGNNKQHLGLAEKAKAGMFHFHGISPQQQGKGILRAIIRPDGDTGETFSDIVEIPITVYDNEHHAHHAAENMHKEVSNTVAFPKAQSYLIEFETQLVRLEKVGSIIATAAQIQPTPGAQVEVIAKASGIVSFKEGFVTEGQSVSEGKELFSLQCGGMMENSMHQYFIKTSSEYERARREYERKKSLAESKIVSESELLEAKTEYDNAAANFNHLKQNFAEDRQIVKAPLNGYIKDIYVQNGQFVEAGQTILTVSQNRKLQLKAELPASYYPQLKSIKEANIREMNAEKSYSLEELNGRLLSYGKSTSLDNPLIPVIFEIDNVLDAIPGTFVNLYIKTQGETPRLSVPTTAIVEEMGNYCVFVQITPELFEKRSVIIGQNDGFRTEIKEGLYEGERIVSKGAQIVKISQATGALDPHAGHAH